MCNCPTLNYSRKCITFMASSNRIAMRLLETNIYLSNYDQEILHHVHKG